MHQPCSECHEITYTAVERGCGHSVFVCDHCSRMMGLSLMETDCFECRNTCISGEYPTSMALKTMAENMDCEEFEV